MNIYIPDEYDFINDNYIHNTAKVFWDNIEIGSGNIIGAFAVIGSNGEIRNVKHTEFKGKVLIGSNNVISEFVSVQRPYEQGKTTVIGNNNIIMAHSHIGHDAVIGSDCEICCHTIVAGYVTVKDGAKLKLNVTTRNRITIGKDAVCGMGAVVTKDVPDGATVIGNPAKEKGITFIPDPFSTLMK